MNIVKNEAKYKNHLRTILREKLECRVCSLYLLFDIAMYDNHSISESYGLVWVCPNAVQRVMASIPCGTIKSKKREGLNFLFEQLKNPS